MSSAGTIRTLVALTTLAALGTRRPAASPPTRDYLVFVGSESADLVALVHSVIARGGAGVVIARSPGTVWAP